jgi:hypothetical protein
MQVKINIHFAPQLLCASKTRSITERAILWDGRHKRLCLMNGALDNVEIYLRPEFRNGLLCTLRSRESIFHS